jgi:tetratricopeptide (TPR) repeat protein
MLNPVYRSLYSLGVFFLTINLFTGCSISSDIASEDILKKRFNAIITSHPIEIPSLRHISKEAYFMQNWDIVWQSQLSLCQLEHIIYLKEHACEQAQYAVHALPYNKAFHFETALIIYLQRNDQEALKKARTLAQNKDQLAALFLSQGKIPEPSIVASIKPGSIQQGQLYYLLGKINEDTKFLDLASNIFTQHNQLHRSADALFLAAKLYLKKGDKQTALRKASKSLLLLSKLSNIEAYNHVKEWFDARRYSS